MNKILILGASGFIGSHFVKKCLDNNFKVYAVSLKKDLKINHKNLFHKKVSLENLINDKIVKINFEYIVNLSGYIDHSISKNKSLKIINDHFLSVYNLINTMPKKKLIKDFFKDEFLINKILIILEKFLKLHIDQQIKNVASVIQIFDIWSGLLE